MKYEIDFRNFFFNCLDLIFVNTNLIEDQFLMGKIAIMDNIKLIEFCFLFFNYSLITPFSILNEVLALVTHPVFFYLSSLVGC